MIETADALRTRTATDPLERIETPALVLDGDKLERNCRAMRERLGRHSVAIRPHVKTAKCIEVAECALGAPDGPITVSTLREAEYFADHGFKDILYAVGMVPHKMPRLAALAKRGVAMSAIVDSIEAARAHVSAAAQEGVRVPALIEIDSDGHRAGIRPDEPRLFEVAQALGPLLGGVMTHAGASYNCATTEEIAAMATQEREAAVRAARALRERGHSAMVVSVGSTPTATFGRSFDGVTEVRAGVYVFQDLVMAGLGVCSVGDIALSVLATVIGHQREKNWLITDGGWMALSRDRGTARQKVDQGYGLVCDAAGRPIEDLIVSDANQEHGIVAQREGGPIDFARFPIGSRLRVLPNHACAMAAQFSEYHLVREGRAPAVWERFSGW
jgi:D-serine deaminase-like pyridoxal phosphate-dependent protein